MRPFNEEAWDFPPHKHLWMPLDASEFSFFLFNVTKYGAFAPNDSMLHFP